MKLSATACVTAAVKLYGPYSPPSAGGRRYISVMFEDGSQRFMPYARYLVECAVGRRLARHEHVHHRDEDFTNDDAPNLELKSAAKHASDHQLPAETVEATCPECLRLFSARARVVRANQTRRGSAGPFCDKSCSGKWTRRLQIAAGRSNLRARRST